jgi:hypothetical protein
MIALAEIQREAGKLGVSPTVVDHDYVLGSFLHFLSCRREIQTSWIFKGGTSLQKCHFGVYRFSEDLDFTITDSLTTDGLRAIVDLAKAEMHSVMGIRTDEKETRIESIEDIYGKESLEARIYYRGPWDHGGSPRSLQIQISRGELISFPSIECRVAHHYSDQSQLPFGRMRAYSLEEVFVEKLRAFSGQRKQAISRDIFDLYHLVEKGVDVDRAISAFAAKCRIKGLDCNLLSIETPTRREREYRSNWDNNLDYLVPKELKVPFELAWRSSVDSLSKALKFCGSTAA